MLKSSNFPIAAGSLLVFAGTAFAQSTPPNLADLVGARGAGGETQLQARGYAHVRTETSGDSKYSYWWNAGQNQCISVRTADGRYAAIVSTLPADCGRNASAQLPMPVPGSDVPEIMMGSNGTGEVIFANNRCTVYYNRAGVRVRALPNCTRSQLIRADQGMAAHRREQGMAGPVADHSPVYRDFSSNRINLICHGDGTRLTYSDRLGYTWDDRLQRYVPQSMPGYGNDEFDAYLTIQLDGNRGRIRLPRSLVPTVNSGGNRGWWDLDNISYSRTQIKARYRFNALNRPRVTINRLNGRIDIAGLNAFHGNCVALDRGGLRWR